MRLLTSVFAVLMFAQCLSAANLPERRLFDAERREGDTRPRPDLDPTSPSIPLRSGEGRARSPGWQPNGIIVCDTASSWLPQITSDGKNGAIICWTESYRGADSTNHYTDDIYAQRVDSAGNFVWPSQGVPVCSLSGSWSNYPDIVADGKGGAIIAWEDGRGGMGYTRVFAQRLDSLGNRLWPENGVLVCNQMSGYVELCSDGHGGSIIAYMDGRDEAATSDNIYAQRIDSAGNPAWSIDGVPVCTADSIQYWPEICANGRGGAIVTWWEDYRNNGSTGLDVYTQMLDSLGNPKCALNGMALNVKPGMQRRGYPVANSVGGGIICWWDFEPSIECYAQSIDSTGNKQWGDTGVIAGRLDKPIPDNRGGCIISTRDSINRVDSSGAVRWGTGIALHPGSLSSGENNVTEDNNGGAVAIWAIGGGFLYAQRVDSSGNRLWAASGIPVCTVMNTQDYQQICSDGTGGAICTWWGGYPGSLYPSFPDIVAQRINANGVPGGVDCATRDPIIPQLDVRVNVHPNPMSNNAVISVMKGGRGDIDITIYDILGRKLITLYKGTLCNNAFNVSWNGKDQNGNDLGSGIYFCRITTSGVNHSLKLLKVK